MSFFFCLNINSISKNFNKLGISKSRILKSQCSTINLSLLNYVIEQTATESAAGEVLLYFNKESVYIEIIMPKKSNLIVGCTYRHPCMDICTFNDNSVTLY